MSAGHATQTSRRQRLVWLDYVRAAAMVWIFLNHTAEQLFGFPYIANPTADWPPLGERIRQMLPLGGFGLLNVPLNALRYVGWAGDQGVQLFLIASGFGLTWSLLARQPDRPVHLWSFYGRRARRLYPMWWAAHAVVFVLIFTLSIGQIPLNSNFALSFLGLRFTLGSFYYISPSWWYIGLLLQLYLIYPLLWHLLRRLGPTRLLVFGGIVALAVRAVGLAIFDAYLDPWLRGAIFITRLPEFLFGMSLAAWLKNAPGATEARLRTPAMVGGAVLAYAAGTALALTLPGMVIAPLVLGVAAFALLYNVLPRREPQRAPARAAVWVGQHSYPIYLVHHLAIQFFVTSGVEPDSLRAWIGIALAVIATLAGAIVLERGVELVVSTLTGSVRRRGYAASAALLAGMAALVAGLAVGAELAVRRYAPQEVNGWGERPSLEPDPTFGWRLKPNSDTRLRWESYDYRVTASSLGFPAPEYPPEKSGDALRILVTGDAFTSAEGVDTGQAWPRLLEDDLAAQFADRDVQVLNFAITGYGPNQYAAVIAEYAPIYQPDLIMVAMFVNDYGDVLHSDAEFQNSIGFSNRPQDGWFSIVTLAHLRQYLRLQVYQPLAEIVTGEPREHGYFLGGFYALERNQSYIEEGRESVAERLAQIKAIADDIPAPVVVLMIPASVQTCSAGDLNYYPRHVDLYDGQAFDLEQPQRVTRALAESLGLAYYDLRPALQDKCYYQPNNMHWTEEGHRAVASYLAATLVADGLLPTQNP